MYFQDSQPDVLHLPNANTLPGKDKRPQIRPDEYADDKIPVVVHGQQHDEIRHGKRRHVQQGADTLLDEGGAES